MSSLYQQTALHIAARKGRDYTVKCLVEQGANIIIRDKDGVGVTALAVLFYADKFYRPKLKDPVLTICAFI